MFIEVKGKPKTVIIQKLTKANKWVDIGTLTLLDGIDYSQARNILSLYPDTSATHHRLILRGKKSQRECQVLSSRAFDFYDNIESMAHDKTLHFMLNGTRMVANNENPYTIKMGDFIQMIQESGGIAKATQRTTCPNDGGLLTIDIKCVDGKSHTISLFYS